MALLVPQPRSKIEGQPVSAAPSISRGSCPATNCENYSRAIHRFTVGLVLSPNNVQTTCGAGESAAAAATIRKGGFREGKARVSAAPVRVAHETQRGARSSGE